MEWFFAQCGAVFSADTPIMLSLALAGVAGSAAHCSVMCAPMAASQMLQLQEQGRSQSLMGAFHAGRLATYAALGFSASIIAGWLFSHQFEQMRSGLLLLSGFIFILSAVRPRQTHSCCSSKSCDKTRSPILNLLMRGAAMGFIPCGMVVAALMLAATLTPAQAILGMILFGLGTVPMLQLAGMGALRLMRRFPRGSSIAARGLMGTSGLILCAFALN